MNTPTPPVDSSTIKSIKKAITELEKLCKIWAVDKQHCALKLYELYTHELSEHKRDLKILEEKQKQNQEYHAARSQKKNTLYTEY